MDLATELQRIYDSEINVEIAWLWDGGIDVRLGDKMNGYLAEENVSSVAEILPWLQEAIAHFYPSSTYASALDAGIRERAARRIFTLREPARGSSARTVVPQMLHPIWTRSCSSTARVVFEPSRSLESGLVPWALTSRR